MDAHNHEENTNQKDENHNQKEHENDNQKEHEESHATTSKENEADKKHVNNVKWDATHLPEILHNVPPGMLEVTFDGKKVENGKVVTPTEVKNKPILTWQTEVGCLYLIAMVDPDAPTMKNPKLRYYQHWIIGNVPANETDKATVLTDFLSSAPPQNTGQHRYVFLVYKQPGQITFTEKKISNKIGKGREKFNIEAFVKNYQLGEPIAGHYYFAEWDSYVTTIEKQLGVTV